MLESDNGNTLGMFYIRTLGDPILVQKMPEVEEFNGQLKSMANSMKRFLGQNAIGLAANQVGIQRRFFVWAIDGPPMTFVNPEIVTWSSTSFESREGCLSLPRNIFTILRAKEVVVKYQDIDGNEKVRTSQNPLESALFQHEIDHLNGIIAITNKNLVNWS